MNVRGNTHQKIMANKEIGELVKILGFKHNMEYTLENMSSLRYGNLMIMTDQDQYGSHIKGLIINFIHIIEEFITPIVKATKGNQSQPFFSLPEFEEWKEQNKNWHSYSLKYYKGLGTSTSKEEKNTFLI